MRRPSTPDDRRVVVAGSRPQPVDWIPAGLPTRYYRVQPHGQVLAPGVYRALLDHDTLTATIVEADEDGLLPSDA